jgi:hypothetical protein
MFQHESAVWLIKLVHTEHNKTLTGKRVGNFIDLELLYNLVDLVKYFFFSSQFSIEPFNHSFVLIFG